MFEEFLQSTEIIDWLHPSIINLAKSLASGDSHSTTIAKKSFEYVRDNIYHSSDYQINPVTYRASDVLKHQTGYCFAKSHLLAALLRANKIPAGFCYQRLSTHDQGAPYSLHGFNALYLPEVGWYRVDSRGNRKGINAQFSPPNEQLAFSPKLPEEVDYKEIFADPLPIVVKRLKMYQKWDQMLENLPGLTL